MKLFVMSDIHGARESLELALSAFERESADCLLVLGDYINHGPRNTIPADYAPMEIGRILNRCKERIIAIRGNCDSEVDQMIFEFPMMSDYAIVLHGLRRCFLSHGHLFGPDKLPPLSAGDIFLFGHSHIPLLETRGKITLVNPGSVGIPKGGSERGYAILDERHAELKSLSGVVLQSLELPDK
jgi:uncharacterized protein